MTRLIPLAVLLLGLLFAGSAHAQQDVLLNCYNGTKWVPASASTPCQTATLPGTTTPLTQAAGTVGTGGTFQTVLAANASRTDCVLQNTSTHTGYVYYLATGSPSLTNTLQLSPGSTFYCHTENGQVIKTAIQYTTSTSTDPFVYGENQ